MGKRFSRQKRRIKGKTKKSTQFLPILPIKPDRKIKQEPAKLVSHKFYISESDRVIYSYETDKERNIQKVVNVCYDVNINSEWITIVRYDSKHGFLHRHMRVSLGNPSDTPSTAGVIKKGKPHKWLSWARKDISKKFLNYRKGFLKRSGIKNLY